MYICTMNSSTSNTYRFTYTPDNKSRIIDAGLIRDVPGRRYGSSTPTTAATSIVLVFRGYQ